MVFRNIKSTNIKSINYNKRTKDLKISFRSNNTEYIYKNVPITVYTDLLLSASKGSFFYHNIRNKFETYKIEYIKVK